MSGVRLPTPLEWFVIRMLGGFYDRPFYVITATGSVIHGIVQRR